MGHPRFHTAQTLIAGTLLTLEESAAAHIGKVLRMQAGQLVRLFDGCGNACDAVLEQSDRKRVSARLGAVERGAPPPLRIELGIGLSRGDRMDYVVQKATELGVHRIVPLHTQRSEVKLDAQREARKWEHWQRVAVSACEQCGTDWLPQIATPSTVHDWQQTLDAELRLVLAPAEAPLTGTASPRSVALLIGPEGGLDPHEIAAAAAAGFVPTRLGPRILRTETAPVAALAVLQYLWGDLAH
jgi:16S rRNA (uracil1498-N3)-methyltransferase